MSNSLRLAAVGAALLAGTAVANAQTVIMSEPAYSAPTYVAPEYVEPAPSVIVARPAPVVLAPRVIAQPPVAEEIVSEPQTIVTVPRERVQETVIEHSETAPVIHRRAHMTRVHLTHAQRRNVLRTIRYEHSAPQSQITRTRVTYGVGSVLPASVPTYAMPREVMYEAPALRSYAYAPVGDRVLLVQPANHMVVDELE